MTHYYFSLHDSFLQILSKQQSALTYLLRVNPMAIMGNLDCNLETGDRSTPPEASRWVAVYGRAVAGGSDWVLAYYYPVLQNRQVLLRPIRCRGQLIYFLPSAFSMLRWVEVADAIPLEFLLNQGDFKGLGRAVQLYMKRVMAIQASVMHVTPCLRNCTEPHWQGVASALFLRPNAGWQVIIHWELLACLLLISGGAGSPREGALQTDDSGVQDEADGDASCTPRIGDTP